MKTKTKGKINIFAIVCATVLGIYTLCMFLFMYLTVSTSLKDIFDLNVNPIGLPSPICFENYGFAYETLVVQVGSSGNSRMVYFDRMLLYSVLYSVGCSFIISFIPCIMAYLVAKYNVSLNKIIYGAVVFAMVFPVVGAGASELQVMKQLGLYNTIPGMWIQSASFLGMYFLVYYASFKSLSNEYMEAAIIDGASHLRVLTSVVLPLVKTSIFAVFILQFIAHWNNYQTPLLYLPDYPTAAVGLFRSAYSPNQAGTLTENMRMAGCVILCIPIMVIFLAFKDIFMGNITVGGIKG
ncbi:MAG: carbohydrate ABC transporter permease [Clostridia bacterium]|nr:carbohydrate ABC transporter permease [Clostridia bacterium]